METRVEPEHAGAPDAGSAQQALKELTRIVPDFPQEGIVFEDLTPVLADPAAFRAVVQDLAAQCRVAAPDLIGGLDARGFLLGSAVAYELGVGILAVRKGGKLPPPVYRAEYDLEYGSAALEIPADNAIPLEGKRILLIDDVLATGGTLRASRELLEQAGATVCGLAVVLEVAGLHGRDQFTDLPLYVVAHGEGEENS
ncbi:MAG TPA: adenine phosphoribosyltransferase [Candidatus Corynebacterium gallistercoris]|uniref:Adenine phosphoribosyltransferase n=1 Tax=Candidatus Corynebacterium gallistercoris TaxID=2838530 RepID=A0A9D1RWM4_9CORY|nr:adenine phosphoribosyltransferase [Candidatus Corynebacterium gallistercoris]